MGVHSTGTHKEQKAHDPHPTEEQKRREMGDHVSSESGERKSDKATEKGERKGAAQRSGGKNRGRNRFADDE
jgi:hypothetical protein